MESKPLDGYVCLKGESCRGLCYGNFTFFSPDTLLLGDPPDFQTNYSEVATIRW
jgi:hypothetical protein